MTVSLAHRLYCDVFAYLFAYMIEFFKKIKLTNVRRTLVNSVNFFDVENYS